MLEQDPRIGKIGVSGWSLGGTVALYSAWSPIIEILGKPFDAHLPFYPAAHLRPEVKAWSNAPMLILHGEVDDWTPIHFVESLLAQLPNTELHVYTGAHHSFDSEKEFALLPKAVHLKKRTARINKNGYVSGKLFLGIRWPLNERWQRRWIIRILRNRGAHVEGHPAARSDALVRAKDFFFTLLVITEPAPIILFSSIVIGATNAELEPIKTLSDILVLDFLTPS